MKKALIIAVAALSASAIAAPAKPSIQFISTEQIVAMCKNKGNERDQGYCGGFGQGVYDGYLQMSNPKKSRMTICIPQDVKDPGVVDAFIAWAESNVQYSPMPASEAVLHFLDQRYPCKK